MTCGEDESHTATTSNCFASKKKFSTQEAAGIVVEKSFGWCVGSSTTLDASRTEITSTTVTSNLKKHFMLSYQQCLDNDTKKKYLLWREERELTYKHLSGSVRRWCWFHRKAENSAENVDQNFSLHRDWLRTLDFLLFQQIVSIWKNCSQLRSDWTATCQHNACARVHFDVSISCLTLHNKSSQYGLGLNICSLAL